MIPRPLCHPLGQLRLDFQETPLDLWTQLVQEIQPVLTHLSLRCRLLTRYRQTHLAGLDYLVLPDFHLIQGLQLDPLRQPNHSAPETQLIQVILESLMNQSVLLLLMGRLVLVIPVDLADLWLLERRSAL